MTSLSTLVEPLKRELAVPGTFADVFPSTQDFDLEAALADGFAEAQLQGFFSTVTVADDGAGNYETTPDLSTAGGALVVLFAGSRILRAQLRAITSSERYKAGSVEFEVQHSANLLREELAYVQTRLDALIEQARRAARAHATLATVIDNYNVRSVQQLLTSPTFFQYELRDGRSWAY